MASPATWPILPSLACTYMPWGLAVLIFTFVFEDDNLPILGVYLLFSMVLFAKRKWGQRLGTMTQPLLRDGMVFKIC